MFYHVLGDGLHQRIIADGLHEDGAVVVTGRCGDVDLNGKAQVFLQQAVVNVLNGFEPGHARIVDVVGFVVEHGKFVDVANDFAKVYVAIGGVAGGPGAEGSEEVVAQNVVFQRGLAGLAEKDAVDVGEEQVADRADNVDIILDVERKLEIVAPVLSGVAVFGKDGVVPKDTEAVEVGAEAVEDDDVRGDEQEVAG